MMRQAESVPLPTASKGISQAKLRIGLIAASAISIVLLATIFALHPHQQQVSVALLVIVAILLSLVIVLHARLLFQLRLEHRKAIIHLHASERGINAAEKTVATNRALAVAASVEAEALRNSTRTLTQDLQLDKALCVLLESLGELVPYECARVLLLEGDSQLFVATERSSRSTERKSTLPPRSISLSKYPLLEQMITDQRPVLLPEVSGESFWRPLIPGEKVSSWLGAPLVIAHHALGVLCAEASEANVFTPAHLRVAGSMAISAAAAVQNARLYQRAEIYGSELEKRLLDLRRTQKALEQAEQERMISEEKFQAVFNSSPIAFSVTSLKEGIFLEVNRSFEQRYGYSRSELLGRTVYELLFWEDVADRNLMMTQLARGGSIRNLITRLRTKSGELKLTAYSADLIQFDGKTCVLAVTGDVPSTLPTFVN